MKLLEKSQDWRYSRLCHPGRTYARTRTLFVSESFVLPVTSPNDRLFVIRSTDDMIQWLICASWRLGAKISGMWGVRKPSFQTPRGRSVTRFISASPPFVPRNFEYFESASGGSLVGHRGFMYRQTIDILNPPPFSPSFSLSSSTYC